MAPEDSAVVYLHQDNPWMQVFFPYDADLVETLKALIPSSARRWDPTEKSWWVLEAFRLQLQELLQDIKGQA